MAGDEQAGSDEISWATRQSFLFERPVSPIAFDEQEAQLDV